MNGTPSATPPPDNWKLDATLFWTFFKIATVVVGGGYAIIAAAQREFVVRRRWLDDADFAEMMTVILTVPGLLAVNAALYLGWKLRRLSGAVAALIGVLLPSTTVIVLIAAGMSQFTDALNSPWARGAFRGVLCGIIAMIGLTAHKLRRSGVHTPFDWCVAAFCFAGIVIFHRGPAGLIVVAVAAGLMKVWLVPRKELK